MKNTISITVTGMPKSGKSQVVSLLKDVLRDNDILTVHKGVQPDYDTERSFDTKYRGIRPNIGALLHSKTVIIREELPRLKTALHFEVYKDAIDFLKESGVLAGLSSELLSALSELSFMTIANDVYTKSMLEIEYPEKK